MPSINESTIEEAALSWLGDLGYTHVPGPQLAPGEPASERGSFGEVVLAGRLREALHQLNPGIPEEAREDALRKVMRLTGTSLVLANRAFHAWLRDGITVNHHLKAIYADGELGQEATIRHYRIVRTEGAREVAKENSRTRSSPGLRLDKMGRSQSIAP